MCYILTAYQHTDDDGLFLSAVRAVIAKKYNLNKDALFLRTATKDFRTDSKKLGEKQIKQLNERFVVSHSRYGTSGENTTVNAHGWKSHGWRFLHNGFVTGCLWKDGKKIGSKLCDSALFFEDIAEQVSIATSDKEIADIMERHAQDKSFNGRCMLWNEKQNIAYLFGDYHLYIADQGFMISSMDVTDFVHKREQFRGISWDSSKATIEGLQVQDITFKNAWKIENFNNPKTAQFKFIQDWAPIKIFKYSEQAPSFDSNITKPNSIVTISDILKTDRKAQVPSVFSYSKEREEYIKQNVRLKECAGLIWLESDKEELKRELSAYSLPVSIKNVLWYKYGISAEYITRAIIWQLFTKGIVASDIQLANITKKL
ncbi:unnamed protein product [Sphagnum balticum]